MSHVYTCVVAARFVSMACFVTKVTGDKTCNDASTFCHERGSDKSCRHCTFFLSFGYHFVPLLRTLNSLIDWFITSFFTFVTHLFDRLFACLLCYSFVRLLIDCVFVCMCVCLGGPFLIIFHHSLIRSFVLH